MRTIAVIDLLEGRAVHAKGGRRDSYQPIGTVAGVPVDGNPLVLADIYASQMRIPELYIADLDAIAGRGEQDAPVRAIAAQAGPVWLDAGVATVAQAGRAAARGASTVIVGLETLPSFAALATIADAIGGGRVAFSLDLRDGVPIAAAAFGDWRIEDLARQAVDAGAATILVLDVARVGTSRGIDVSLFATIRQAVPSATLIAGGGIRGADDLRQLTSIGADGVLMATALHGPAGAALARMAGAADHS